jgi:3-hydroxyisobutyrate dehydrogenase-like beta-hydroxyacid dehydrogenase
MSLGSIAVLGLGAMGSRVAARLVDAGHEVAVWNRTKGAAAPLQTRGAQVHPDPSLAVADAELVLVCVRDDAASADVWAAAQSALSDGVPRVDLSTITPQQAQRLASSLGPSFLAAPMIGSRPQIEAGQLTLLVGGPSDTLERVRGVLEDIAGSVHHVGDAADAARLKLAVNGLFAAQLAVAGELLEILRAADSDVAAAAALLESLPVTSPVLARSLPRILQGDAAPNFPLDLVAKDLDYLIQQAGDHGTPVLDAVLQRVRARGPKDDIIALATAASSASAPIAGSNPSSPLPRR